MSSAGNRGVKMGDEAFKVQGALAVVLRLSRALGLAPLRFAHDRGGYIATVSRQVAIYSCILTFCTHSCELTRLYVYTIEFYEVYASFPVGSFFIVLATIFVTGVGSYGSIYRMKNIAKHSNLLNKINYDLNGKSDIKRNKSLLAAINTTLTILFISLYVTLKCVIFDKTKLAYEVFEIMNYIGYYKIHLLYMENTFLNFDVYYILQTTSLKLREWVDKSNSDNIPGTAFRLSLKRFRDLTRAYVSVCVAVKGLNATRGGYMFMLFSANSLFLTMGFFNLIDVLFLAPDRGSHTIVIWVQALWCVYHLSIAVLFIEPWHQISAKVNEIRVLLTKLIFNVTPVGKLIPLELDLMFKQLLLNQPTMSPLELVTIQRSLLTATISFITTYFVIMVQYVRNRWEK